MMLTAEDFLGDWQISREISDFRLKQTGTLEGRARFVQENGCVHYAEAGTLRFAGGAPLTAERRYLWTFTDGEVLVAYDDGAPFHSFAIAETVQATPHLCGEDMYHGTYLFGSFPDWEVLWSVKGPRKDYRSVTRYRRA
ncbi:DUF6314 family protein [Yoonia litorea]|uniref:DUF6314 domain-containing protein n=1 Tax=Yoonia litorea TaxID=1123755 RepID=A0A1I6LW36_9RHOB|nr:DUF6314 family protein [Yoonia litorea]SFS07610.1 hypothetical protein SAMN05444714_0948 [Yoonia litorea]